MQLKLWFYNVYS